MTHEQSNRESQEADRIRAIMDKKSAENVTNAMQEMRDGPTSGWYGKAMEAVKDFAEWGNEIGDMVKDGPAGQAYDTARGMMADVNRRVVEEPWYGKPVADILFERQQSTIHGQSNERTRPEEQETARPEPAQQTTIHGENKEQQTDRYWDDFYRQRNLDQDRGQDQDRDR